MFKGVQAQWREALGPVGQNHVSCETEKVTFDVEKKHKKLDTHASFFMFIFRPFFKTCYHVLSFKTCHYFAFLWTVFSRKTLWSLGACIYAASLASCRFWVLELFGGSWETNMLGSLSQVDSTKLL